MNMPEISQYHKDLAAIQNSEPDRAKRVEFLAREKTSASYLQAKEEARRKIELLPQQQVMLWANKTLEEYSSLSQTTGPERKKAKNLVREAARILVQDPEKIDVAASIWKSRESTKEQQKPEESFYELVKQETASRIKEKWETVTPEKLAHLIRIYANSVLAHDFTHEMLKSYFKGPQNRKQRIDARYAFASTALDLLEDDKAFNEAIRIGLLNTDIVPIDSVFMEESHLSTSLPWDIDDKTLQRHMIAQNVLIRSSFVSSEDFGEVRQKTMIFAANSEKLKRMMERGIARARRKIGNAKVESINKSMIAMGSNSEVGFREEELQRLKSVWPGNLVFDEEEPLNLKFRTLIGSKEDFEHTKKYIVKHFRDNGVEERILFLTIFSPEGLIIDIAIPQTLIGKKKEVIKFILNLKINEEDKKQMFEKPEFIFMSRQSFIPAEFEKQKILINYRQASGIESNQHPLQSLELIGFPSPQIENGKNLALVNQQMADEIRRTQLRFLNRRGIRIPIDNKELKEFGYSHIDLHKDQGDPEKTLVRIFVGDIPYFVRLDKNLNFDFEGKRFNVPFLHDALKFTILSLLKPILCEEKIQTSTGQESDLEKEVISRMGHLRLLPANMHRTKQAIANCNSFEGKDLLVLNAERKEMLRIAGREVPQDREYTYVKPIIEKEENLPPITIHLPGVL